MKQQGFDLLLTRDPEDKVDFGNEIAFPPLYKIFANTFVLGTEGVKAEKYIHNKFAPYGGYPGAFGFFNKYNKINEPIENFESVPDILAEYNHYMHDEPWIEHKLLRIAYLTLFSPGGLYVGCGEHNQDEIWIYDGNERSELQYRKITNNIFEFVQLLTVELEAPENIPDFFDKAYKKWGDEYWRVPE